LKKSKAEKPLTEQEQKEADEKELTDLQSKFADKKRTDKKFTTEEASQLWEYAKKTYMDKGVSLWDAMKQTGLDVGLTYEQVNAAFKTPKTKPITDAAWVKQYQLRKNKAAIDNYIENSNKSAFSKGWKAITRIPKAVTTAIHGHVFPGTHYPMGFLTPQDWNLYFKTYGKSIANAYGTDAYHEQQIQSIVNDKNYAVARRAGLANDVERTDTDDFENAPKIFGKIGKTGTKGFLGLKWLRQQLFNRYWDALPKDEQTDEVAENIAYLINSATLASNIKIPAFMKEGLFSAGMESARWGKVFKNPVMAAKAATRITASMMKGEKINPADKVFVKIWGSRVGQQLGFMVSALAINAYIQSKLNPKNPVNLTDPTKPDYLMFKVGNNDVDLTGGVLGIKNFLLPVAQYAINDKSYKQMKGDIGGKALQYGRNKLSPFYGDMADIVFGTDWAGNPLPFSNQKPSAGHHKLSWGEYFSEKAPIFASDALQNMFTTAKENGLNESTTEKVVNGIMSTVLTGGLGLHNKTSYMPYTPKLPQPDYTNPEMKSLQDKGYEFGNPNLTNLSIPEKYKDENGKLKPEYVDRYVKERYNQIQDLVKELKDNGIYKVKDLETGEISFVKVSSESVPDNAELIQFKDISTPDLKRIMQGINQRATDRAQTKIFTP